MWMGRVLPLEIAGCSPVDVLSDTWRGQTRTHRQELYVVGGLHEADVKGAARNTGSETGCRYD